MIGKAVVPRDNFSYLDGRIDFCEYLRNSDMGVSENTGPPKSSILYNRVFHYKPSILAAMAW